MISVARIFRVAMILGTAQLIVGIAVSIFPNPEGWVGGVLYAAVYALPLLLLGLLLRSRQQPWCTVACVRRLLYDGRGRELAWLHDPAGAIIAVGITVPTVVADVAIFWAVVLHRLGCSASFPPQAS